MLKERKEEEKKKQGKENKILRENKGKNRAGSGWRIERKQSVFFLFPKERRREEARGGERRREEERRASDGRMRTETLSPAAPQD